MAEQVSVSARLELRLVIPAGASLPVSATLTYDRTDPYAVTVAFETISGSYGDSATVQWTFARSLLQQGLTQSAGEGDVRVWPAVAAGARVVCLSLSSPSGDALFEMPLEALADFLAETYFSVPDGAESELVDVDAELALLVWADPET